MSADDFQSFEDAVLAMRVTLWLLDNGGSADLSLTPKIGWVKRRLEDLRSPETHDAAFAELDTFVKAQA